MGAKRQQREKASTATGATGATGASTAPESSTPTDATASASVGSDTGVEASTDSTSSDSSSDPVVESGGGLFEQASSSGGLFEQASAGEGSSSGSSDSSSPATYELSGYVRGDAFMGKIPEYRQGYLQAAYGELSLQLRAGKSEYGDAFAETRLRYGMQGNQPGYEAELREGYVNTYLGPIDIRLGQQIIVWGKADGFNPTNNLTPTNLSIRSPHDDDRRVGNFAQRACFGTWTRCGWRGFGCRCIGRRSCHRTSAPNTSWKGIRPIPNPSFCAVHGRARCT